MNEQNNMSDKYKFISAIIQLVLAVVLVGISVYYVLNDEIANFLLFLIVGIIFIVSSVRTIIKFKKGNKESQDKE